VGLYELLIQAILPVFKLDIFHKQAYKNPTIQAFSHFARVAELVDAQDLK